MTLPKRITAAPLVAEIATWRAWIMTARHDSHTSAPALGRDIVSFVRHLNAGNLSPKTIRSYREAVVLFGRFLAERGMPAELEAIRREHVEAFIVDLLER